MPSPGTAHFPGCPWVDVTTGHIILTETDLEVPHLLALMLRRTHVSSRQHGTWFGACWASALDERLVPGEHGLTVLRADGRTAEYRYPRPGVASLSLRGDAPALRRSAVGDGYVLLDPRTGVERHFFGTVRGGVPLVALRDRNGNRVSLVRSPDGTPVEVRHTDGLRVLVETDAGRVRMLRLVRDDSASAGDVVQFDVGDDEDALPIAVRRASGTTYYSYDGGRRLQSWEDSLGSRLRFEYDGRGRCVVQRGPDGVLDRDFDHSADPDREGWSLTVVTDALGHRRTHRGNAFGQVVHEDDDLGRSLATEYDAHDRLLQRTDGLGRCTRYDRDDQGRLVRLTRPDGSEQTWEFHEDTELATRVVDPDGGVWLHQYDDRGNRVRTTDPGGTRTSWTYDAQGALLTTELADGTVVRHEGGAEDAATSSVGPTRKLGPFGVVATETTREGEVTTFEHDRELRLVRTLHPDGRTETFARDVAGRVREHVDVAGRRTAFEHDAGDQVVAERSGTSRATFEHDPLGRLTRATTEHAELVIVRDPMGRVLSESVDGRAVVSTYDAMGRRTSRTTPSGSVASWTHDPLGRVVALAVDGHETAFERNRVGHEVRRHLADAAVLDQHRDTTGRLVGQRLTKVGPVSHAVTAGTLADRLGGGAPSTAATQPLAGPHLLLERSYDPQDVTGPSVAVEQQAGCTDPLGRPLPADDVLVWDGDTLAERVTGSRTTTWTYVDGVPVVRVTQDEHTGLRELCSLVTDPDGEVVAVVSATGDLVWQQGDPSEPGDLDVHVVAPRRRRVLRGGVS
jgi:YD repeat-containing protein